MSTHPSPPLRQSSRLSRQFIVRIMLASNWIVIVRRILLIYLWNFYVTLSFFSNMKTYTGCLQKNFRLLWNTIAPLKMVVGTKVGGVLESAGADLSGKCHNFPVAQKGAEIFEFKVEPVPKLTFLNGPTLNSNISAPS